MTIPVTKCFAGEINMKGKLKSVKSVFWEEKSCKLSPSSGENLKLLPKGGMSDRDILRSHQTVLVIVQAKFVLNTFNTLE